MLCGAQTLLLEPTRSRAFNLFSDIRQKHYRTAVAKMDPGISSCQPVSTAASSIIGTLKQLSKETREFVCDPIDVLHAPVDACTFLRQYVATNTPVLIKGAIDHWAATELWSKAYLDSKIGSKQVSVELTPNGFGDAVTPCSGQPGHCFCMPHSAHMRFDEFTTVFFQSKQQEQEPAAVPAPSHGIPYLSQQNSNLTQELPQLLDDVEAQLEFGAAAFGAAPDAVNLWIGDQRAATTFHKDHYENLYCVLRGKKIFHLLPPTELYRMSLQLYPAARYEPQEDGQLQPVLLQPASSVMWCPITPEPSDAKLAHTQHPLFFDPDLPAPLRVEVNAGETLYLPAMWWHYVEQRACPLQGWCIAVNYWYDMQFDARYATYKMVEALAQQAGLVPIAKSPDQDEIKDEID